MKKYLTLEDLYNYYSTATNNVMFDSKEAEGEIVVQIPAMTTFEKADDGQLVPVTIRACHTKVCVNRYDISHEVMTNALGSIINKPILGFIHEVDGVPQFYRHNHHIEDNEIVYEEYPIGVIPESANPHLEYDEEADVERVVVNGLIFAIYSKAAEIIEREGQCNVSVEMNIKKMTFDVKRKVLVIHDFEFSGVTILGVDDNGNKIIPGMAGSNITLADFSAKNNGIIETNDEKLKGLINSAMADFNKNLSGKGGETTMTKNFEISHDDIRCALYNLLDTDERDVWINAVYDNYCVYEDWNSHIIWKQGYSKSDEDNTVQLEGEAVQVTAQWLTADELKAVEALRQDLADMTASNDNAIEALNELKAEKDELSGKLANYEAEPSKMELFEKYGEALSDNVEFNELKKTEAHFTLSLEELSEKIDSIILNKAKATMFEEKVINTLMPSKPLIVPNKVSGRYGDIFAKR